MLQLEKVALLLSLGSVVSVAACADPPAPRPSHCPTSPAPTPAPIAARTEGPPGAAGCSVFVCGDNAPETGDGFVFDELDVCGEPNYAGVRITGATRRGSSGERVPVALDVDRHDFFTVDADGTERRRYDMIGTIISLEHTSGEKFEVLFDGFSDHENDFPRQIVFQAGLDESVPSYLLRVRRTLDGQFDRFVCNHDELTTDPTWASAPHDALVFRGDRYHPTERRLLENDPASGWIFLACAGGAGAKMHLYRHTHAGGFLANGREEFPTTLEERTTLAKAITADYCGTGEGEFTRRGQPLRFAANQPWWPATGFSVPGDVSSIEGIWTPSGLMCLDDPRLVDRSMIPCAPSLGPCGPVQDWQGRGYAITANP